MSYLKLTFLSGLPGFENEHAFLLVEDLARAPLVVLESETTPGLHFHAVPLEAVDAAYDLQLGPEDLEVLGLEQYPAEHRVDCFAILALAENGPLTANLLAPVVVNRTLGRAVQAVRLDRRYSHVHPLGDAACS